MSEITKVTVGFREWDIANITKIQQYLLVNNKAEAIANAICLAEMLYREMRDGNDILIRNNNTGGVERVKVQNIRGR